MEHFLLVSSNLYFSLKSVASCRGGLHLSSFSCGVSQQGSADVCLLQHICLANTNTSRENKCGVDVVVAGLTSLGVYYGLHHKYVNVKHSVELLTGLALGSWSGLELVRRYRKARWVPIAMQYHFYSLLGSFHLEFTLCHLDNCSTLVPFGSICCTAFVARAQDDSELLLLEHAVTFLLATESRVAFHDDPHEAINPFPGNYADVV